MYDIRRSTKLGAYFLAGFLLLLRSASMFVDLRKGNEASFLAFPLTVLLPASLILFLCLLPPAKSQEGALMRLGTIIQLLGIIAFPQIALYLALGLPVVFLVVELYATRFPISLQRRTTRIFIG